MATPHNPGSETAPLTSLISDPRNVRRHTDRTVGLIEQALREVGAARSIVVDETGILLAGNATVTAATKAGIDRVRIVEADGAELIAVRRSGLSPEQKRRAGGGRRGRGAVGWYEDDAQTRIFEIPRPSASPDHPTSKPVALFAAMLANSTKPKDVVLDPFGGSGSTLIACEQLGRACRLLELDPRYCDVVVKRWEQLTGQTAERLVAAHDVDAA